MNPDLDRLQSYPFEKLTRLFAGATPPPGLARVDLSIGEPKHPVAGFIRQAMIQAIDGISRYPTTRGEAALRRAIVHWLEQRFALPAGELHPDHHVLPVNGTREALFSIAGAVVDRGQPDGLVLMPNPFYQIYEGAALMAGATPFFVDATAENGFLPDYASLPEEVLARTQLLYLCSPGNPTGAVHSLESLIDLVHLAQRHDFVIVSDECYSEIWYDRPPPGILEAAQAAGVAGFRHCLAFQSLSKRSNMPGARSGFVAGDAEVLERYFKLRTYTGCATPPFVQAAAIAAWGDEDHVAENRRLYRDKLKEAVAILGGVLPVRVPEAGFYLWLEVPGGGEAFARRLYEEYNVIVLPGGYLGRPVAGPNPGSPYVRVALVAGIEENREGLRRLAACAARQGG